MEGRECLFWADRGKGLSSPLTHISGIIWEEGDVETRKAGRRQGGRKKKLSISWQPVSMGRRRREKHSPGGTR